MTLRKYIKNDYVTFLNNENEKRKSIPFSFLLYKPTGAKFRKSSVHTIPLIPKKKIRKILLFHVSMARKKGITKEQNRIQMRGEFFEK